MPAVHFREVGIIAIHVSERTLSRLEYENQFHDIYGFLKHKIEHVPKRRQATIAKPLLDALNDAFETIMSIEEDPVRGTKTSAKIRYDLIVNAQIKIKRLEQPLWVWWNIAEDDKERRVKEQTWKQKTNICDKLNSVLELLHKMQTESSQYKPEEDHGVMKVRYYTNAEIENATFLSKLRKLHQFVHSKHIRLSPIARDAESGLLVSLVNNAWYYAVKANQINPHTNKDIRLKYLDIAVRSLSKAERPLFDLLNNETFSNNEMRKWIDLHNECVRLLCGVRKSTAETK